jgi:hypothetical protein
MLCIDYIYSCCRRFGVGAIPVHACMFLDRCHIIYASGTQIVENKVSILFGIPLIFIASLIKLKDVGFIQRLDLNGVVNYCKTDQIKKPEADSNMD